MKYPIYSKYRKSEIETPHSIPTHWEEKKFRFLFTLGRGLGITKSDLVDEGIPCINYGEIHSKYGFEVVPEKQELKCVVEEYLESSVNSLLETGEFVFADTSEDLEGSGNFAYLNSNTPTFAGYHTVIARPQGEHLSRYIAYFIDSSLYRSQIRKSVSGVKVFSITQAILKDSYIWLPPIEEQKSITVFLDSKIQRIDLLIEKKKVLIEKLEEQRIAVITQAVTKGIHENAKLKPSGVDWFGDVPEHWDVLRAKFVSDIFVPQRNKPELNLSEGMPWITMDDMKGDYISKANLFVDKGEQAKAGSKILKKNSVIASCVGNFGISSVNSIDVIINQQLQAFIPKDIDSDFLREIILVSRSYFELIGTAATLVYVNQLGFENMPVPLPKIKEQVEIVSFIKQEKLQFKKMITTTAKTIETLQEYRSAIITSVVTGKIDVRNIEIPEYLHKGM